MANVLAEEAFNAFPHFLSLLYLMLLHSPPVFCILRPRLEAWYRFVIRVALGNISHEVLNYWEGLHGGYRDRPLVFIIRDTCHASELRVAVDFSTAGSTLTGLAIPPHSEIRRLLDLDAVDCVENDHALIDIDSVAFEMA